MAKKEELQRWPLEEGVWLRVDKAPGKDHGSVQMSFNTGVAVARGIGLVLIEAAEQMGVPVEHLLCVVTTILLADAAKPDAADSQVHGRQHG